MMEGPDGQGGALALVGQERANVDTLPPSACCHEMEPAMRRFLQEEHFKKRGSGRSRGIEVRVS